MGKFTKVEKTPEGIEIEDCLVDVGGGIGTLVGTKIEAEPGRTEADGVIPLIDGYTIAGGLATFPIFAGKWPSFVSGPDLVVPNTWNGSFTRNLGGNAEAFETPQTQGTAVNGLSGTSIDVSRLQTSSASTGGSQRNFGQKTDVRNITLTSTDTETRPTNFALQYYLRLDNF